MGFAQFPDRVQLAAYLLPRLALDEAPRLLDACTQFVDPWTARIAQERGYRLIVCDATPETPDVVKVNLDATLPWGAGHFRGVICSDTLEHVDRPSNALRELARVTELGGFLILHIPVAGGKTGTFQAKSYPLAGKQPHDHKWALGTDILDMAIAAGYRRVAMFCSYDDERCRAAVMWILERTPC